MHSIFEPHIYKTIFDLLQVILMDHVDWLDNATAINVAQALARQVRPLGVG